jgi:BirA family biotin operon repressor/biotin-[acetyl-CoA-carboxylase] ligase
MAEALATAEGVRVLWRGSIDSTNEEARRLAAEGERGPLWIAAAEQTAGRGRLGRGWVSPPGNLYATLLVTLSTSLGTAAQASLVAALAMADTVRSLAPAAPVRLKWPNDVLIAGEKVSGILVETLGQSPQGVILAIGCGLNLAHAPQGQRRPATSVAAHGPLVSPDQALAALAGAMQRCLGAWRLGEGFDEVRCRWLEAAGGAGERIAVDIGGARTEGAFAGLDRDGALRLLLADGSERIVRAGDVLAAPGAA